MRSMLFDKLPAASFQRATGEGGEYMEGMDLTSATKAGFIKHFLPPGARVLVDIGSGTGKVPAEVAKLTPGLEAHAVEYNEKYAKKDLPVKFHFLNFMEKDLPFVRHGLNVIINNTVYEKDYYAGVRQADGEGITIAGQNGQALSDQDLETRFPSHNYVVLEKF